MHKRKAFSLIELSISLLIIGIILTSVFKGLQLVEYAKIQSIAKQFQEFRVHVENYMGRHGIFPGQRGVYATLDDTRHALTDLYQRGIMRSNKFMRSKLGGVFKIKTIGGRHYLQLISEAEDAILNLKQVEMLQSFFEEENCLMDGDIFSFPLSD